MKKKRKKATYFWKSENFIPEAIERGKKVREREKIREKVRDIKSERERERERAREVRGEHKKMCGCIEYSY